jgi:hypothetical protein
MTIMPTSINNVGIDTRLADAVASPAFRDNKHGGNVRRVLVRFTFLCLAASYLPRLELAE